MPSTRRAIVVGTNPLARQRIREDLARFPDLAIVAEALTSKEAITSLHAHQPDILFFQPKRFPNAGLDLTQAVQARFPSK